MAISAGCSHWPHVRVRCASQRRSSTSSGTVELAAAVAATAAASACLEAYLVCQNAAAHLTSIQSTEINVFPAYIRFVLSVYLATRQEYCCSGSNRSSTSLSHIASFGRALRMPKSEPSVVSVSLSGNRYDRPCARDPRFIL